MIKGIIPADTVLDHQRYALANVLAVPAVDPGFFGQRGAWRWGLTLNK